MLFHTAICAALCTSLSFAQTITWGPVQNTTGPGDVSTNGALVVARNLHGNNSSPAVNATANGVLFTGGFQPSGWGGYVTTGLNGSTTGDAGYDAVLNGARATTGPTGNPTGWGAIQLDTLATLTPGSLYEIQCWYTDQRTGTATNVLYDRVMTLNSAIGTASISGGEIQNLASMVLVGTPSGPLEADPDDAPAVNSPDTVFGQFCTGTFTYVPGFELWLLIQGSHPVSSNSLRPHLTALQIRDLSTATWTPFGSGCAGSAGVPSLDAQAGSLPRAGQVFLVDLANLPNPGAAFVALGFDNTAWLGLSLPFDLRPFGMAGCNAYINVDTAFLVQHAGTATQSLSIPTGLNGLRFFVQGLSLDPAAGNAAGAVTSNAGEGVIGS